MELSQHKHAPLRLIPSLFISVRQRSIFHVGFWYENNHAIWTWSLLITAKHSGISQVGTLYLVLINISAALMFVTTTAVTVWHQCSSLKLHLSCLNKPNQKKAWVLIRAFLSKCCFKFWNDFFWFKSFIYSQNVINLKSGLDSSIFQKQNMGG